MPSTHQEVVHFEFNGHFWCIFLPTPIFWTTGSQPYVTKIMRFTWNLHGVVYTWSPATRHIISVYSLTPHSGHRKWYYSCSGSVQQSRKFKAMSTGTLWGHHGCRWPPVRRPQLSLPPRCAKVHRPAQRCLQLNYSYCYYLTLWAHFWGPRHAEKVTKLGTHFASPVHCNLILVLA